MRSERTHWHQPVRRQRQLRHLYRLWCQCSTIWKLWSWSWYRYRSRGQLLRVERYRSSLRSDKAGHCVLGLSFTLSSMNKSKVIGRWSADQVPNMILSNRDELAKLQYTTNRNVTVSELMAPSSWKVDNVTAQDRHIADDEKRPTVNARSKLSTLQTVEIS